MFTNRIKKTIKPSIIAIALSQLISLPSYAVTKIEEVPEGPVAIEKLPNAQVFAEFNDKLPAVLNYFTQASEQEVIEFYQNAYGEIVEQTRKYGRLTVYFQKDVYKIRIAISTQDRKRQVDVLINEHIKSYQELKQQN